MNRASMYCIYTKNASKLPSESLLFVFLVRTTDKLAGNAIFRIVSLARLVVSVMYSATQLMPKIQQTKIAEKKLSSLRSRNSV
jgi:hypothetical protein